MSLVGGIITHPTAIAAKDLEMVIAPSRDCHECPIILSPSAKEMPVALRYIHVVIHRDRETFAPVAPCESSVFTHIETAIIGIVHAARSSRRHQKMMMIRMRIMNTSAIGIPPRRSGPRFAAVSSEMEVNAATKNVIRMLRMNGDRIPIRNLTFRSEMTTTNFRPPLTSVGAAEYTQNEVAPIA